MSSWGVNLSSPGGDGPVGAGLLSTPAPADAAPVSASSDAAPESQDNPYYGKPIVGFDVSAARSAGYSDNAIASYLADKTGFNLAQATKAGYNSSQIIDYLAPLKAAPEPESSAFGGFGHAIEALPGIVAGGIASATAEFGKSLASDTTNVNQANAAFDAIDKGQAPAPGSIHPKVEEQYTNATPEQRAAMRANMSAVPEFNKDISDIAQPAIAAGQSIAQHSMAGLTPEEQHRFSVRATLMVGQLLPMLGAAAAGDLPALIGLGGLQGYGEGYDNAKAAGMSDEDANSAGAVNGIVQGGLMAVPVHTAMGVLDALPAIAKSSVLKAVIEVAKSSTTMVGFSQLSTLADNAVAKATGVDPNRDIMQGVGDNLGVQALVGAVIPVAGAGLHIAGAAAKVAFDSRVRDANTTDAVMTAPDVDGAIKAASDAASSSTPVEDIAAGKAALDAAAPPQPSDQQAKLNRLFTGLNTGEVQKGADDTYTFSTKNADGQDVSMPLKVWDPASEPDVENGDQASTISPELAQAQSDHYAKMGIDVVYFQNDANVPFDGVVDPSQPNTIFLSNDPQRNAAQVGAHEVTHALEDVKLPDGTNLADLLYQQVREGITDQGQAYAEERFGSTAPQREGFAPGPEGDEAHTQAVTAHLVTELAADLGGEAPKFNDFFPKVMQEVETRFGGGVVSDVMQKFMDGIRAAMETIKGFFGGQDEGTFSQNMVSNLGDIHDTLAKMYAEKYGQQIDQNVAAVPDEVNTATRDDFLKNGNAPTVETPAEHPLGPAFVDARTKAATYARWLGELGTQRDTAAAGSPEVRTLRQTAAAILGRVGGVESRLTGVKLARLAQVRKDLAAAMNPKADTPDMAQVRESMVKEHGRMADLAAVGSSRLRFSPRERDNQPFFSALSRNIEDMKQDKAPPGQWAAAIDNLRSKGVKQEEIDWSGVKDWLGKQTGPVSKTDLVRHLQENEVKIQEVLRSANGGSRSDEDIWERAENLAQDNGHDLNDMHPDDQQLYINEVMNEIAPSETRHDAYALPGGKNYHELLLTMPKNKNSDSTFVNDAHFNEPNILAHVRFDDREGPNGEKILHVAEVQSDWHQAGRKKGYQGQPIPENEKLRAVQLKAHSGLWRAANAVGESPTLEHFTNEADAQAYADRMNELQSQSPDRVANAPLKDTKEWTGLAMKRMLRYAAENGYDSLSWDTGETNADRYDLSKHVNRIGWVRDTGNPNMHITIDFKNGARKNYDNLTPEKLAGTVGKEIADRITNSKDQGGSITTENLAIGGEGMATFYDELLPSTVNKLVKKFGGKVEDSSVLSTPEKYYKLKQYADGFKWKIVDNQGNDVEKNFYDRSDAKAHMDSLEHEKQGKEGPPRAQAQVATHSVEITPQMREGLERSQPLFSPRKVEEPKEGVEVPPEVAKAGGLENSEAIASSRRWQTGRELKMAIQDGVQNVARRAGVDLTDKSVKTTQHLTRAVTSDVMHALAQNSGAIGWYDLKTRQSLRVAALVRPEINTDPNARFAFVYALAATSNGVKVDKNFDYAEQVYGAFKKTGQMPTDLKFGLAQESINKTLETFNMLSSKWGLEKFRRFMLTNYAMKDITALTGIKPAGEHADTVGRGAAIMGPKVGNGFFSNLYGHFDALTMDRWLIRTWGRHTGTLVTSEPAPTEISRARVREAVRGLDPSSFDRISDLIGHPVQPDMQFVDDLATSVKDASADPGIRSQLSGTAEGDELRKASINLVKYLDGQKEAPDGPHERVYIREVFNAALDQIRQDPKHAAITMADMQAVLWYAEKRLYGHAKATAPDAGEAGGVKGYEEDAEVPDYANAAVKMVKNSNVAVLNDTTLTDDQKKDRLLSDRKINAALEKEANGRAVETQSGFESAGPEQGGERSRVGGFTDREKRAFAGAVAAQDIRSARLSDSSAPWSYLRTGGGDGQGLRVLKSLGVTYDAEWKAGTSLRRAYVKNGSAVPARILELAHGQENAERFVKAITDAKNASKNGAAVAVYPAEDYAKFRLLLADDGKSGVAVKPDGDIVSVFATNGTGHAMMDAAIAAGGKKLDAFDTVLPDFYHSHGFIEASRLPWDDTQAPEGWNPKTFAEFNDGKPDVVFMALDRGPVSLVLDKAKSFNDYDAAARAQERLVKKLDKQPQQSPRMSPEQIARIEKIDPAAGNLFRKANSAVAGAARDLSARTSDTNVKGANSASTASTASAANAADAVPKQRKITMPDQEGKGKPIERALNEEKTRTLQNAPQVEAARALVDKDPERALRIAMRQEQPPKGMLPTFPYFELERRATAAGDTDMIEKLRTSPLAREVTTAGRLGQSFATRDPLGAVSKIDEANSMLEMKAESIAKNTHGSLAVAKEAGEMDAEKAVNENIKKAVRAKPIDAWQMFVDSVKCR